MKTTLELPDELMRKLKVRAAATDRKLKDTVEEVIRRGLEVADSASAHDRLQTLKSRLRFHADGSITNPDGIDDPAFFDALDEIRARSDQENPRDPFA